MSNDILYDIIHKIRSLETLGNNTLMTTNPTQTPTNTGTTTFTPKPIVPAPVVPKTTSSVCYHDGDIAVWEKLDGHGNRLKFVLADSPGWKRSIDDVDIVIDLSTNVTNPKKLITSAPPQYSTLNNFLPKAVDAEVIKLDWPYDGIDVGLEFWREMLKLLPLSGRVMITDYSAHSKAPACLAALMMADGMSSAQATDHIRQNHCNKVFDVKNAGDYIKYTLATEAGEFEGMNTHCAYCSVRFIEPSATSDICQKCYDAGKGKVHSDWKKKK